MRNFIPAGNHVNGLFKKAGTAASQLMSALFVLVTFVASVNGYSQGTLGNYSISALTGAATSVSPSGVAANVGFSTLIRGNGLTAINQNGEFASQDFSTSGTLTISNNDYLEFTITPGNTYSVSLSTVRFDLYRGSSGPTNLALRSSVDGYATTIGTTFSPTTTAAMYTISLSTASFQNFTSPITFRLYGWSATSNLGSLRLTNAAGDNGVEVDGVVNAPFTATFFGPVLSHHQ